MYSLKRPLILCTLYNSTCALLKDFHTCTPLLYKIDCCLKMGVSCTVSMCYGLLLNLQWLKNIFLFRYLRDTLYKFLVHTLVIGLIVISLILLSKGSLWEEAILLLLLMAKLGPFKCNFLTELMSHSYNILKLGLCIVLPTQASTSYFFFSTIHLLSVCSLILPISSSSHRHIWPKN